MERQQSDRLQSVPCPFVLEQAKNEMPIFVLVLSHSLQLQMLCCHLPSASCNATCGRDANALGVIILSEGCEAREFGTRIEVQKRNHVLPSCLLRIRRDGHHGRCSKRHGKALLPARFRASSLLDILVSNWTITFTVSICCLQTMEKSTPTGIKHGNSVRRAVSSPDDR